MKENFSMPGNLLLKVVIFSIISGCLSQDAIPRPTFPDAFQTEIEGIFAEGNGVAEIDVSLYFDRPRNRAALSVTKDAGTMKLIFNFDDDESLAIDGNTCEVQPIPEEQGFFPYKLIGGKKKMLAAEEAFYFTKSKLEVQSLSPSDIPTLIYKAIIPIPQFGQNNCELLHVFSKPDLELSTCREGIYCNSTIMSLSVKCRNAENSVAVDHVYRFFRFWSGIEDESVFLPPPGIHCDMKNSKDIPKFPPYFSFTFDIIQKQAESSSPKNVFSTHKEVWYDSTYRIIRIDEYGDNGLLYSSRIFDMRTGVAFTIIATNPICDIGNITDAVQLDEVTRLPKSFFDRNDSSVYVGKRKVHGLDYDVWSQSWTDSDSAARVVEEVYYLQIVPNQEISMKSVNAEPYYQLSHADIYTYEVDEYSGNYELVLLKHYSINNYRSKPKEWAAFDVLTCFDKKDTKTFSLKVNAPPIVKGSQSYREILELLYSKILKATSVSVVRISELRGVFDGVKLVEIKGSILDNSESSGWPEGSKEPGMIETFDLINKAASENRLSVSYLDENNKKLTVKVTSVEEFQDPPDPQSICYSGSSLAAASLVLLIIGVFFGITGYYVFLKKRRAANVHVKMSDLKG